MNLDYSIKGQVKIWMIPYTKEIVDLFGKYDPSSKTATTPAAEHIFKVNNNSKKLSTGMATIFHHFVAKCLFATKRARPDIAVAVTFLTSPLMRTTGKN